MSIFKRKEIKIVYSFIDQFISSGSNFLVTLILARLLNPDDYGTYILVFTSLLMLNGFQNAFILTALSVYGSEKDENSDSLKNYISGSLNYQAFLAFCISVLALLLLVVTKGNVANVLIGIILIQFFMQGQEFIRRVLITRFYFAKLITNDIVTHLLRFTLIGIFFYQKILSLNMIYISLGAGYGLGLVIGLFQIKKLLFCQNLLENAVLAIRKNWFYSKWILGEIVTYNLSTQLYVYLTAIYINNEATGALGGIQSIYNIFNVLMLSVANYALPLAAQKKFQKQFKAWKRLILRIALLSFTVAILIISISFFFPKQIINILFGNPVFLQYSNLIYIFGFISIIRILNSLYSVIFNSIELPQLGFYSKLISAIVTLVFAYPLLKSYGVYGSAFGVLLTQFTWLVVYNYSLIFKKSMVIHAFK